jgi:predicted permease
VAISLDNFRIAARTLRKQPVFATVVILSLALAIALNTTMYGVLDAMMHPRLDLRDPGQLYSITFFGDKKFRVDNNARDAAVASGMRSYQAITWFGAGGFQGAAIERGQNFAEAAVDAVAPNFFDVVGPRIISGRTFAASDAQSPEAPIVITDGLATELFPKGEPPVGARIMVEREAHLVIGVVSQRSNFPNNRTMAWTIAPPPKPRDAYSRIIRLRRGATVADAARELDLVAVRIATAAGESPRDVAFRFRAVADSGFQATGLHFALMFAVGAVLLVACANLANLQLARGISRRRDLALRSALGATRRALVAHLLTESVILVACGLAAGLLLCFLGGRLLGAFIPPAMGRFAAEPHLTWRVLVFAVMATVISLVLIGVAPSIYVSRADPGELLKAGAGTGSTKHNRNRYGLLVAVEIGLALALSSAAVLTVRNALQASQTWYGYDSRPLITGLAAVAQTRGTTVRMSDALQRFAERMRAVDGVADAAASAPGQVRAKEGKVTIEDAGGVREFFPAPAITMVSPSYLRTIQLPIVRGRDFFDGERDEGVVIVDQQTARTLWPNANPVGAQIKFGDMASNAPFVRVVGVAGEQPGFESAPIAGARMYGQRNIGRAFYLPGPQDTVRADGVLKLYYTLRARSNPALLPIAVLRAMHGWGDVTSRFIASMDVMLGLAEARQSSEFISSLFTLFATIGVGLAAFGVYGVVAHSVAERRRELGVRIALGATARDILHAVLRESVVVALSGVALGLLITKLTIRHLDRIILEDDVFNAPVFASVALALVLTAAIAALIPALRATRVDPTESLRND